MVSLFPANKIFKNNVLILTAIFFYGNTSSFPVVALHISPRMTGGCSSPYLKNNFSEIVCCKVVSRYGNLF